MLDFSPDVNYNIIWDILFQYIFFIKRSLLWRNLEN